jgi:hypothetical protein
VEKNVTDKTSENFLIKIFKRHDKDKDGLLNKEGKGIVIDTNEDRIRTFN